MKRADRLRACNLDLIWRPSILSVTSNGSMYIGVVVLLCHMFIIVFRVLLCGILLYLNVASMIYMCQYEGDRREWAREARAAFIILRIHLSAIEFDLCGRESSLFDEPQRCSRMM